MKVKFHKVRIAPSTCHGLGLFADEDIGWGLPVIEYTGQKISGQESARRIRFYDRIGYLPIFELGTGTDIDGLVGGNEARFINHSKARPNCAAIRINGCVLICALDNIKRGTELFFDYGFDPSPKKNKKGVRT